MLEVCAAVAGAIGAERTGLRLSPYNSFLSAQDSVERAIDKNVWLMKELDSKVPGLAYIHMVSTRVPQHSISCHKVVESFDKL
jgi:NADPH2 dehydrogenase